MDARGPKEELERAACPRSEAPLLSPVVMVQEAAHDDATIAFLLSQTLLAEKEAKEGGGELVADLASKEQRLLVGGERVFARSWDRSSKPLLQRGARPRLP